MTEPNLQEQLDKAREYIKLLLRVYQVCWYDIGGLDPGDGSSNVLITFEDDQAMVDACEKVEPHEVAIRAFIAAGELND